MTETNVDALPWEEPPKPSRGGAGGVWIDRLKPLMELPGRSKVVFVGPAGRRKAAEKVAYSLRHGKLRIPDGDWEFTSRWIEAENVSKVYARYLGAGGPDGDTLPPGGIIAPAVARETTEEYEKRHQALGGV